MAKYKSLNTDDTAILNNETGASFQTGSGNSESSAYDKWIAQGNAPDPADIIDPMIAVRAERDSLLKLIDIEILKLEDVGLDATAKRTYRQALRDVPANFPNADMATFDWTLLQS